MKDKLGKDLVKGDFVVVTCKDYRNMVFARIIGFTPQQIRVIYLNHCKHPEKYLTTEVLKVEPADVSKISLKTKEPLDQAFADNA